MPIAAVPHYLGQNFDTASPGLRFGLYLRLWGVDRRSGECNWSTSDTVYEGRGEEKEENKSTALKQAARLGSDDRQTMRALLERQQQALAAMATEDARLVLDTQAVSPFTTGLGNEHPLENGFAFLNPYGLPYLPGSGVKGVVRRAAEELADGGWGGTASWSLECSHLLTDASGKALLDPESKQPVRLSLIDLFFGREDASPAFRGLLQFWDVIPQVSGDALMVEIMTPHQGHYYQQTLATKAGNSSSPHESGQPNPIPFLTVPPGSRFVFHVTCDMVRLRRLVPDLAENGAWKPLLEAAMQHAFEWLGFGAKTAVGYGAMGSEAMQTTHTAKADERYGNVERSEDEEADALLRFEKPTGKAYARVGNSEGMVPKPIWESLRERLSKKQMERATDGKLPVRIRFSRTGRAIEISHCELPPG
ncbi:type III-B CRISPR module RAMP protein Cmr6 [Rehaibacterium terrae]|jgi:CRISPR-associated protein Cmr6|uniref:CRISPR-associated protein Cmr6 n=1 Tax=Rehaibacterium terrae TaxID=1341696 RepID=A0A7W8DES6_9GAMM|nr:type III-B CRISPR module RAMP protein Cmr6 [Rehaibacterium terrae]MBB5015888.1 CRISPR-associated protein Cmr6 [Rehaibacterium terrae]